MFLFLFFTLSQQKMSSMATMAPSLLMARHPVGRPTPWKYVTDALIWYLLCLTLIQVIAWLGIYWLYLTLTDNIPFIFTQAIDRKWIFLNTNFSSFFFFIIINVYLYIKNGKLKIGHLSLTPAFVHTYDIYRNSNQHPHLSFVSLIEKKVFEIITAFVLE